MTQIPAESSAWRRAAEGRVLGTEADFPPPREPYVSRYGFEPERAATDEELMPPFPEAHRGEWLEHDPHDAHYARLRDEYLRQCDADFALWRRERFGHEFEAWRSTRPARRVEPFISPAGDERAAYGDPRDTETFFERS